MRQECGGAGGICAGVRREGAGARRGVVGARVHPATEYCGEGRRRTAGARRRAKARAWCRVRSARAEVSCTRGVREVVDVWVEVNVMVAAGRARVRAQALAR